MLKSLATVEQYKIFNRVEDVGGQSTTNETEQEIQLYLDAASAQIRKYTSQDFVLCEYTEFINRNLAPSFVRVSYPAFKILSMKQNNSNFNFSNATIAKNMILSPNLQYGSQIFITYVGGYKEVPADIIQATVYLASLRSREKDRIGIMSLTNGPSMTSYEKGDMPEFVKAICKNYREWFGGGSIVDRKEFIGVI